MRHRNGKVRLDPPEIVAEVGRLGTRHPDDPRFPLLANGIREMRSQNSWMHDSPTLMRGDRRHRTRIHPDDARAAGLADGGRVRIVTADGAVESEVLVTDEMRPGTIAIPEGWGHRGGGWRLANSMPGVNVNELTSNHSADLEALVGMSVLNGVPVRIETVGPEAVDTDL